MLAEKIYDDFENDFLSTSALGSRSVVENNLNLISSVTSLEIVKRLRRRC